MLLGVIHHHFGETGVVVEHLHIIGDSECDGRTGGECVFDLHATPIGFGVQGALVTVTAAQEEKRVELPVTARTHARIEHIHRTD